MKKLLLKDNQGKPSYTTTAFVLGLVVVNAKFLFSGLEIGSFKLIALSGVEYAAALAAVGALYNMRAKDKENGKKD
jgi:hypothetical protein